ncbi:MAG TPA: HAMP domain-containing sensor histidine kinase [Caulobacteraceae bacterium]|nr:HAMP domain-containing sensor histidine kinase [Caulobacteraceae bacterium]
MRFTSLLRRTPFRLTLLFLALFAAVSSALLAYIYVATRNEAEHRATTEVRLEMNDLQSIYNARGGDALNEALVERILRGGSYLYRYSDPTGKSTGNISPSPITGYHGKPTWQSFTVTNTDSSGTVQRKGARGEQIPLAGGGSLFVGIDQGEAEEHLNRVTHALWGAGALVLFMGLLGGLVISRNVERSMGELNRVVAAVEAGDIGARAKVRGGGDELDELAIGLNAMLARLEQSMASIRHAGDAIAHDLRSPLTRMRAKLEVAMLDAEAGKIDPKSAVVTALDETDELLKTFNAVLAISRLRAAGEPPNPEVFDAGDLGADMAELYEPASEDMGLDFKAEVQRNLMLKGNREFIAQALANLIDNSMKYTPKGGAVMLRTRRRSNGEIEFSVTDTGPGVPEADRDRVVQRFVRLENSRTKSGSGLGLALVQAVAEVHGGRLELSEGPGMVDGNGPGLRAALVFPPAL